MDYLRTRKFKLPDAFHHPFMEGRYRADAIYTSDKVAVFFEAVLAEAASYLRDRGFGIVVLGTGAAEWEAVLASNPGALPRMKEGQQ